MILNIYRDRYQPRFILHSNDFIIEHNLYPLKIDYYTSGLLNDINILIKFKPIRHKYKLELGFCINNVSSYSLNLENITRLQDLGICSFSTMFSIIPNSISKGDLNFRDLILVKSLIVTKEEFKSFIYHDIHFNSILGSCFSHTDKYNFIRLYLLRTWLCSYIPDTEKTRYIDYTLSTLLGRVLNSL